MQPHPIMAETTQARFLRYVAIDTQSDPASDSVPSTPKQYTLLRLLVQELHDLGIAATINEHGYVMGYIPSNVDYQVPAIGFISHVDTSPDMSGANVKPQLIENYQGQDIVLNKETGTVLKVAEFPELLKYCGQTLITTDGTTLLGADDKAGVAEIMSLAQYLVEHPQVQHGKICIGFTPDEEIGRGVDFFDVKNFGATYAYTIDGGEIGELEYENFNAAGANIHIQGRNIHPGYAKGKMINAILVGMELNALLPAAERPEHTQGYEGFFHLVSFTGEVEQAVLQYIIRDHNMPRFEHRKQQMQQAVQYINNRFGQGVAQLEIKDQYYNMRSQVEPHIHIVEIAQEAMRLAGVEPLVRPIRGGTDGSRLSYMGLPCPNIFAGGHNFHGKYEFVPVQSMNKAVEVLLHLVQLYAKRT